MRSLLLRIALLTSLGVFYCQGITQLANGQNMSVPMKNQQSSVSPASKAGLPAAKAPVTPADPVITILGLCSGAQNPSSGGSTPCETEVSRQEFESLINAVDFEGQLIQPAARKRFAETYADLLVFERAARNDGLSDTSQFKEILRWLSLRTMADMYYHMVQEKNAVPTQDEIDGYYKKHLSSFESVRLTRILIPRDDYAMQDNGEFDRKAQVAANKARERAVRGENPDEIQKDVYAALGLTSVPPTDMGTKRREDFLPSEADDVFRLVPGEVSQIEKEPRGYVIYKVVSKITPTVAQIRNEISKQLTEEQTRAAIQAVRDSAKIDFNIQYFGSASMKPPQPSASVAPATPRH